MSGVFQSEACATGSQRVFEECSLRLYGTGNAHVDVFMMHMCSACAYAKRCMTPKSPFKNTQQEHAHIEGQPKMQRKCCVKYGSADRHDVAGCLLQDHRYPFVRVCHVRSSHCCRTATLRVIPPRDKANCVLTLLGSSPFLPCFLPCSLLSRPTVFPLRTMANTTRNRHHHHRRDHDRHNHRRRKLPDHQDFEPLSVIGEGHFGKVLLVRWNNGAASSSSSPTSSSSSASSGGRHTRPLPSATTTTATIEEGSEESKDSYAIGASVSTAVASSGSADAGDPMTRSGRHGDDRYLAVKEVALHKGTSLPGVLNERQILGVLREHPFVVTLRCAWRRGNFLYYGLDFLPGADLFELFRRNSIKMDLQAARVYGGQMALALEHLHDHGICYRDLKVRVLAVLVLFCTRSGQSPLRFSPVFCVQGRTALSYPWIGLGRL